MVEWRVARIGDVAERVAMGPFGSSVKVATFVSSGVPVISGQHLRGSRLRDFDYNFVTEAHAAQLAKANVQRGDVILTHAGNIGQVAYIPATSKYQRYVISQRQFYIRCDTSSLLPEFLTYYLGSPEGQHKLLANANQTGVPSIAQPVSYIRTVEVPVPPVWEQRAIAAVLGALDDKIESNQRVEQLAGSVLSSLAGEAEDQPPVPLNELAASHRTSVDPTRLGDETVDHYSIPAYDTGRVPECCAASGIMSGKFVVSGPSILVSRLNPSTQRLWYVRPGDRRSICSTEFLVLTAVDGLSLAALWIAVSSPDFLDDLARRATGTSFSHQRVRPSDALAAPVPDVRGLDPGVIIEAAEMLELDLRCRQESRTLAALRDALLPELLSGRLRVREAERVIEDVV